MYIKDFIKKDYKDWIGGEIIFIEAPTGSGKTTFVLDVLVEEAMRGGQEVLYITNRYLLKEQIKRKLLERQNIKEGEIKNVDKISEFDGITVLSYQKLQGLVEMNRGDKFLSERYLYVVFDEIHYIIEDSLFNPEIVYLVEFIQKVQQIKIFMSATITEAKSFLIEKNIIGEIVYGTKQEIRENIFKQHRKVTTEYIYPGRNCVWEYMMPEVTRDIEIFYYKEENDLIEIINERKEKFLIFINNKSRIKNWKRGINDNVISLSADSKEDQMKDEIVNEEKFEARVLITTKILDNGVNFIDSELKNIVIDTTDETEFLQMLGRKRLEEGEKINLFIPVKSLNYFNGILHLNVEKSLKNISQISEDTNFYNRILRDDIFFKDVRKFFVFNNKIPVINECAREKLKNQKVFFQELIEEFRNDDYAFVKKQLKWIHKEESFDIENNISFQKTMRQKDKVLEYLNTRCGEVMDIREQKIFSNTLIHMLDKTGLKIKNKGEKSLGKCKINKIFKENGYPFSIISRKSQQKGEHTKWILSKAE